MTVTPLETRELAPGEARSRSRLSWYTAAGKRFFLLAQQGAFADNCYDHGRLLAKEIEDGVFAEIIDTIRVDTDTPRDWIDTVADAIYRRISTEVFDACSSEFRHGVRALGSGIFDALDDPIFTQQEVIDANVAIDAGNLATGLTRRLKKPLAAEVSENIFYVIGAVLRFRPGRQERNVRSEALLRRREIGAAAQRGRTGPRCVGFGCTGFAAAPDLCADGRGLHARNFDGAFFAWNRYPGIFLTDERETNPSWHRFASVGTAGLIYPGGISGMNDRGIACSLHQMSTVNFTSGDTDGGWEIAPVVQQRILREAGSLDEAVDLVRDIKHFASWTIVVSDARAGRSLRIELNGREDERNRYDGRVEASEPADRIVQSNHFLAAALAETNEFFGDAHFTPSVGKWLETRARLETVAPALDAGAGSVDTDFAIDALAGHRDGRIDGAFRSFGRTVCKAYGIMTSIARADPDRDRADDALWFTLGERLPGPHSTMVGFAIDWDALSAAPVADRPVRKADADPAFLEAMTSYIAAFEALWRPRDANGRYLGRMPDAIELDTLRHVAIGHMDRAVAAAEDNGFIDPPLRYIRARLCHEAGEFERAAGDWARLRDFANVPSIPLHDYELALVHILSAATESALGREAEAEQMLAAGERLLDVVQADLFPAGTKPHQGFADWRKVVATIRAEGAGADLPDIDFVTVE